MCKEPAMTERVEELVGDDVALLAEASNGFRRLEAEVGKVIIGQTDTVRALLAATFCEGHVLLVGVPGLAKTLLVKTLAQVLGWDFRRIQFTPDMMPADIIGMELLQEDADGNRAMRFVPGPVFANIILADEINRTPPKTQSALLEAMQELQVTSMGNRHELDRPFIVVATQNPIEQEGTYPLPEAQLDRFMFSLWMDYPGVEDEERIVLETTSPQVTDLKPVFTKQQMMRYQALVRRMPVSRHVVSYAVALARATRPGTAASSDLATRFVQWGAGPRAGQHMVLAGKAMAVLDGSPTVTAGHIRQAAPRVLRHRVLTNYQAAGEGMSTEKVVALIIDEINEPRHAP
jgi:MoxR-like ATPase